MDGWMEWREFYWIGIGGLMIFFSLVMKMYLHSSFVGIDYGAIY